MKTLLILSILAIITIGTIIFWRNTVKKEKNGELGHNDIKPGFTFIGVIIMLLITIGVFIFTTLQSVSYGNGAIPESFGKLRHEVKAPGLQAKYPWESFVIMSSQQQTFSRNGIIQAKDTVSVSSNIAFHYILNLSEMPFILENYGKDYVDKIIYTSADEALKRAAINFDSWDDLLSNRTKLSDKVTLFFKENVIKKLIKKGLEKNKAEIVFIFPMVDIKKLTPPKQIQININLKKSAEQTLERKDTELKSARKDAKIRALDGEAVRNALLILFNGTDEYGKPKGNDLSHISPEQMVGLMQAMANNRRSESFQTMVEQNGVSGYMVIPAGTPVSITPHK